jgi:coproporphyrinogen III oxidase-like Fe-S oxidoreductase
VGTWRVVRPSEVVFEFALNAMRLWGGFDLALFEDRTALPRSALETGLSRAEAKGLVRRQEGAVALTELGQRFIDDLVAEFIPDDAA